MAVALGDLSSSMSLSKRRRLVIGTSENKNNIVADESKKASSVKQLVGIRGAAQETGFDIELDMNFLNPKLCLEPRGPTVSSNSYTIPFINAAFLIPSDQYEEEQQANADLTKAFTTDAVFNTRDELVSWCKNVGKVNGVVVIVAKSDLARSGRPPRIRLACTRRGKGINKRIDKLFQKCGCPFSIKGLKLPQGDKWKLQVVCGLHNHPLATEIEGHLHATRPTTEEEEDPTALDCAMSIGGDQPQTKVELKMHMHPSKTFKVRRTRSTPSTRLVKAFSEAIQLFIKDAKDVFADGNCGFRAVAELLGRNDQDGWKKIRAELTRELQIHKLEYFAIFGVSGVKTLLARLDCFDSPAPNKNWMMMPEMGHLISSCYNVVLIFLSCSQCLTFLPLRTSPGPNPHRVITLGFINDNHFIEVFVKEDAPIPPVTNTWTKHHHACAGLWEVPYMARMQQFCALIPSEMITPEIIGIDDN